ncbi:hypothetical protein RB594_006350 [Gaeumannomyces avenae]
MAQPDFTVISRNFEDLGQQFGRCVNLPSVAAGGEILRVLERIDGRLERIEGRLDRLEDRMERLEGRMERIETRATASDSNGIARVLNSAVRGPEQLLHPLRAAATNEEIPDFPRQLEDIDQMNGHTLGIVLRALDQSSGGGVPEKRKRLKGAIGIAVQAL